MKTAFFYIIGADEIEPVKVGVAISIWARISAIQVGNPYKLSARYSAEMPRNHAFALEREVLEYFSSKRENGEWLSVDWRILAEFADNTDPAACFDKHKFNKTLRAFNPHKSPEFMQQLREIIHAVGSPEKLCKIADVSRQALAKWTRVPAERVLRIERATGIPRHRMRPDLYPPEEYAA